MIALACLAVPAIVVAVLVGWGVVLERLAASQRRGRPPWAE